MSTLTTTRPATLPRVNLLPEEIAQERRFRLIQGGLALAVVAALAVIGALFLMVSASESDAQDGLDRALAKQSDLKRELRRYDKVPPVYAQVEKAETQLVSAFGTEVRWSGHLLDVLDGVPENLALTRIEIFQPVDASLPPTVEGLDDGGAVIGRISLHGIMIATSTGSRGPLASYLESLTEPEHYANPYFTLSKAEEDRGVVRFESTVDVNEQALSRRFTGKDN